MSMDAILFVISILVAVTGGACLGYDQGYYEGYWDSYLEEGEDIDE